MEELQVSCALKTLTTTESKSPQVLTREIQIIHNILKEKAIPIFGHLLLSYLFSMHNI